MNPRTSSPVITEPFLPPDTYSVSQLGSEVQDFLAEAFSGLWVGGEVQRPRSTRAGHFYFELVEKGEGETIVGRIEAVLWRRDHERARRALQHAGVVIEEGQILRCFGAVDFYPPAGRAQLVVREVDPLFTLGALTQRRQATLLDLASRDLLDRNASLPLPSLPLRIALIASRGSAGAEDFLATLGASHYAFEVELVDVVVQGSAAEREVVAALSRLDRRIARGLELDVLVLVRGGGARTDLAAFDSPGIAEAVAVASRPVLTGLGHEIDQSVTDRVAHRAFKTPTGVAEFLCRCAEESERRLESMIAEIRSAVATRLEQARAQAVRAGSDLERLSSRFTRADQRLVEIGERLCLQARHRLRAAEARSSAIAGRWRQPALRLMAAAGAEREDRLGTLKRVVEQKLRASKAQLAVVERLCEELAPVRVLARGFSITRDAEGRALRSPASAAPGDVMTTELQEGLITSRVEETKNLEVSR